MNYKTPNSLQQIAEYKRNKSKIKRWYRVVAMLSAIVVFCTTYALILPAITQERTTHCGDNGHVHTDDCYIDKTIDAETAEIWEATLPTELSGDWSKDIIAVAKSQLGYKESSINTMTGDDGAVQGYTRYGAWCDSPYGDWSSSFIAFCLSYANVDYRYFPYESNPQQGMLNISSAGFFESADKYVPNVGDIVFFRVGNGVSTKKIGFVSEITTDENGSPKTIRTIEGDFNNSVASVEYSVFDEVILGYGNLGASYTEFLNNAARSKTYSDEFVTVNAAYFPSAGIHDGATLIVKKIEQQADFDEYDKHYQEAVKTLTSNDTLIATTKIKDFLLYDIYFEYEGKEVRPLDKVDIKMTIYSPSEESEEEEHEISILHYGNDGVDIPENQEAQIDDEGKLNASFETDSFSLFAVITSETIQNSIIKLSKHSVTSSNVSSFGGKTFAIVANGYALSVDDNGNLTTTSVIAQDSGITANANIVRWKFTRNGSSGSRYYISTTVNGTEYYLYYSNSRLSLSTSRTSFSATRTSADVRLSASSRYITLSASGVSMGSSAAVSLYSIPTGTFTVQFDGRIGYAQYMSSSNRKYSGAENVSKKTDSNGYVTLPTPEETKVPGNYPLRLNGWYDIINRVYYDSSMFGKSIKVTNNTIFYPEWVAATYDIGQDIDVVKNQPDTSNFITTTVFDYNELFNIHSAIYSESNGTWSLDADSELGFVFFDYITQGNIGNINNKNVSIGGVTVNEEKTKGKRGSSTNFPGTVTSGIANDARLDALFGDGNVPGRMALGEADWLYSFDEETGYYYYNSAVNAASYNQSEQRFYVYDYVVNIDSQNSLHDFLPFNYGKTTYAEKDNEANYWFGMKSEIDFYLPYETGSNKNIAANGKDDMQFRFSGDDDVWIFIDGQLALDLGGVHDVVYGEINFSTGEVKIGQAISSSQVATNTAGTYEGMPGVSGTVGVTTSDLPMTLDGGENHTITVYYLERGSSLSNCAIYFNLSPSYELQISKQDSNTKNSLSGAKFQIFDDEACTVPSVLYVLNGNGSYSEVADAVFTADENGLVNCFGLMLGKTYYIKEIVPPVGYPDMSRYIIKVNLSKMGESTLLSIDSNGEKWDLTEGHIFTEEGVHRIELIINNDKHVGGEKVLYVEKVWAEGSKNIPDEVTIELFANGEKTSRSIVLSAENDWKGFFYELPIYDQYGNEYVYTVVEANIPEKFYATYTEAVGVDPITGEDTPGFTVTNAPLDKISIPVQKNWHPDIPEDERTDVTLMLYLVTIGDSAPPTEIYSITLTPEDGWKGVFDQIPLPEDGTYYCVTEITDRYAVDYSDNLTFILINNKYHGAAKVEVADNGKADEVIITNLPMILMPETGGCGIVVFALAGILIVASTLLLILYRTRKRYQV